MLHVHADFPAAGSTAFLALSGEQVRIQRRNADGTILISRARPGSSGNATVAGATVFATPEEALGIAGKRRRRAGRRS